MEPCSHFLDRAFHFLLFYWHHIHRDFIYDLVEKAFLINLLQLGLSLITTISVRVMEAVKYIRKYKLLELEFYIDIVDKNTQALTVSEFENTTTFLHCI